MPGLETMPPEKREQAMKRFDKDGDGKVSKDEFAGAPAFFDRLDADKDGFVSADELKALEAGSRQTIDIVAFIPERAVDPVFFDKAYFLAPDKRGAKPYSLLLRAMRDTGRIVVEVEIKKAPVSAANFLRYVDAKRLDGITFYRTSHVAERFGAQGRGIDRKSHRDRPLDGARPAFAPRPIVEQRR